MQQEKEYRDKMKETSQSLEIKLLQTTLLSWEPSEPNIETFVRED